MASGKCIPSAIAALLVLCCMVSIAQSASVEALYSELDKLPQQQRQRRLEVWARKRQPARLSHFNGAPRRQVDGRCHFSRHRKRDGVEEGGSLCALPFAR